MMSGANTWVVFLGLSLGALTCPATAAEAGASPYQVIVERNAFALKPREATVVAEPPPPPAKITLTGITTLLGNKRALLSVAVPGKPNENFMLTEGQREGEIEVIEIDEKAGQVRVRNHGVEQSLNFQAHGAKLASQPVQSIPPPPGVIPPPNAIPAPGIVPPPGSPTPMSSAPRIPLRSMRLPQLPGVPRSPAPNPENPVD